MKNISDQILAATTEDGTLSIVAGITTELTRETQRRHQLTPIASVAVGRLATGASLLAAGLKGHERISLQIVGDGPLGGVSADVALNGEHEIGTRAYVRNADIDLPQKTDGGFDVAAAIGSGRLQVTKSYEIGQPYVGIVDLENGEIGDDLAGYLLHSQQIPSIVSLGVHYRASAIVAAGGVLAQVMPNADESFFEKLQERAQTLPDFPTLIAQGASPRELIDMFTGNEPLRSLAEYTLTFTCRCTLERVEVALLGLGREELEKMADEDDTTEAVCEFCRRIYLLKPDEVRNLARRIPGRG